MTDPENLKTTPLAALHRALQCAHGAVRRLCDAGPVSKAASSRSICTRAEAAGLFDVSPHGAGHVRPKSGRVEDAALALETLAPVDVLGLKPGRQRYALLTNDRGGILDDFMVANRGDHLFLVVNAGLQGRRPRASAARHLGRACDDRAARRPRADRAAGPGGGSGARRALRRRRRACASWTSSSSSVAGVACRVSPLGLHRRGRLRDLGSGGARGSARPHAARRTSEVAPVGLGARDSLRLEAGLCLYGHDIDTDDHARRGEPRLGDPEGPPQGRRPRGRLSRSRAHPGRARERLRPTPRRPAARRAGRRCAPRCRSTSRRGDGRRRSAPSPPAASARPSARRSPWATCRRGSPTPGTRI